MSKINPLGNRGYLLLGLLAILFSISALAVVLNIDWLRDLGNDLIYDSKKHHLSCDQLPASEEVARVVLEHQETVQKIEDVNPGFVMVQIDIHTCPGRSEDLALAFGLGVLFRSWNSAEHCGGPGDRPGCQQEGGLSQAGLAPRVSPHSNHRAAE